MSSSLLSFLLLSSLSAAPSASRRAVVFEQGLVERDGRLAHVGIIKLKEGRGLYLDGVRIKGPEGQESELEALNDLFLGTRIEARFPGHHPPPSPLALGLADLRLYLRFNADDAEERLRRARQNELVESAWLAFAPQPPPSDIPPTTPDFYEQQACFGLAPDGLGLEEAARWPGGDGRHVQIADVEYGWDPEHEDLDNTIGLVTTGFRTDLYLYHGNSVLAQLVAPHNGYGVRGMVPAASPMVAFPFTSSEYDSYDVAAAILSAAELLAPGDVILIEQQSYMYGDYCPVEVDPAVFDAIALAVSQGIVVVEPAGNGAQDLDDDVWRGAFQRDVQDSGAIMVGGGASPLGYHEPRSWFPDGGSCYGSRVDLQGWYDSIVTATSGEYGTSLADLYFPGGDTRQAYTESFGGTSGASPMITAVAAILQSITIEEGVGPIDPWLLRSLLRSSGVPQAGSSSELIGPQPDLRSLLRLCLGW